MPMKSPTPTNSQAEYHCTGGRWNRDVANMLCSIGKHPGTPRAIRVDHIDMGGPLDAPTSMPSGAMSSTQWQNGLGRPLARVHTIDR